jgi:pyridoxamine 5'-phosphate oxidase
MSDQHDYRHHRREYEATEIRKKDIGDNPVKQFALWLADAESTDCLDPTAMTLATVNAQGFPSARIVLLKHFDHAGFVWYTDYESQKGQDLNHNPHAALSFYWPAMSRQIQIQGTVKKISHQENTEYFHQRPRASQISAASSCQSHPIDSKQKLQDRINDLTEKYADNIVPKPSRWGGYCLQPTVFEFWQGNTGRLHDRLQYQLADDNWQIRRLQP